MLKNVLDKSIIQVQKDDSAKFSLYEYSKRDDPHSKLIAMQDETVRFPASVYEDGQTLTFGKELRGILHALWKKVFQVHIVNTGTSP